MELQKILTPNQRKDLTLVYTKIKDLYPSRIWKILSNEARRRYDVEITSNSIKNQLNSYWVSKFK